MRKCGKPVDVVRVGNFTVPIYATPCVKHGRTYEGFTAQYRDFNGRQRIYRSSLEAVRAEVKTRVVQLASGECDVLTLRSTDRHVYERAKQEAMGLGMELDEAVVGLRRITERARKVDCTVEQALEFWSRHHDHSKYATPVSQVVEAFVADRKGMGNSAEDIADIRHRLRRFGTAFDGPLRDITKDQYLGYFSSLPGGLRDRKNHRATVRRLINWAKDCDYLERDHEAMPRTTSRVKIPPKRIQVFERDERELMIQQAGPVDFPATLVAAYAPLRSKEVGCVSWEDIDWGTGYLTVYADGAKKRESRMVYLVPELLKRLSAYRQQTGRIYPYKSFNRVGPRLARKAGIKWIRNGWRCSVISHMQAFVRDLSRVANEAGNSPGEIKRSYLKPMAPEAGRAWFGIPANGWHPLAPAQAGGDNRPQRESTATDLTVNAPNVIPFPLVASQS